MPRPPPARLRRPAMKLRILRGSLAGARDRGVVAVADDDGRWALVNLSPAVALELGPGRRPQAWAGLPDSELVAVILTDAHVDHAAGLLSLREGRPLELYATPAVFEDLTTSLPMLPVLEHYCGVHWHVVPVAGDRRVAEFRVDALPSLAFSAIAIDAPAPPYAARADQPVAGDTVALVVRDLVSGQSAFCAPGLTQIGPLEFDWMRRADCLLLDAPADDAEGADQDLPWIELLAGMPARHKVMWGLAAGAPDHGIARAYDGMEIEL